MKLLRSPLTYIIFFFTAAAAFYILTSYPWRMPSWDESVYVLMGKYIFSNGEIGLVEKFRPLFWPTILGSLSKIGLEPISTGLILTKLSCAGCVVLTFLIAQKAYGLREAWLAATLLFISPTYTSFSNTLFPDILASFLGLLSLYLFFSARHMACGTASALAFQSKFTQITSSLVLSLVMLTYTFDKKKRHCFFLFFLGSLFIHGIFLGLQYSLYGDALRPFKDGALIYLDQAFIWYEEIPTCLNALWKIESPLIIYIPFAIWATVKKGGHHKAIIAFLALSTFIWITRLPTELPRFFITTIPYLYLLCAQGIWAVYDTFQNKTLRTLSLALAILLILFSFSYIAHPRFVPSAPDPDQLFVLQNEKALQGKILWLSWPQTIVLTDLKASELIYYIFDSRKAKDLISKIKSADYIFLDSWTFPCPHRDPACPQAKDELIQAIRGNLEIAYGSEPRNDGTITGVYRKPQHQDQAFQAGIKPSKTTK